ncbi:Disulfide oxidoreductase YuzD [Seinonella peptonophila]|uniref:Disulfide oxidoreductase YuzD n=1 Tax=Seinonella peptonophila TaxID=112248 RepID=A0A1M4WJX1_9BACL|nr:DUF1462 family protein [Seinonella peptonophila]SHE81494.1 Disulfide oxidoreductase YuzD [Seinonella peptonophila]
MITLYVMGDGDQENCSSCVQSPSSAETATWLDAALKRRFGTKQVNVQWVDVNHPRTQHERQLAKCILEEEYWYPVVMLDSQVIAEGNPRLKEIVQRLVALGVVEKKSY